MMKQILLLLASGLIFQTSVSQKVTEKDFSSCFRKYGMDGCFVLYDQAGNSYVRYNPALCDSGYIPASTFKIPNSLIALEEGIVKDTSQVIRWDGHEWPNKNWNQDQTLGTSIKYSCVWVYIGFAEKIGIDKYAGYLKSFNYGNLDLSGPPTRFWLNGPFRISANQQIDFLRNFYNYTLPVSRRSVDIVKDIIVLEKSDSWKLSGKTGTGMLSNTDYIMWFVGYLEKDNTPYFFAMNFKTSDFDKSSKARFSITKDILRELKLIE
jgi:beta-lactamase class D